MNELLGLAGVLATIIGLVSWIVRASFARQAVITDRYFAHLEETQRFTRETNDKISASFDHLSSAVNRLNERTEEQAALLRELTEGMGATRLKLGELAHRLAGLEHAPQEIP